MLGNGQEINILACNHVTTMSCVELTVGRSRNKTITHSGWSTMSRNRRKSMQRSWSSMYRNRRESIQRWGFKVPVELGDLACWFGDLPDVCAFFLAIIFNIGDPEMIGGNFLPILLAFNWVMTTCI
jgi:hypothetical protein